MQTGQRNMSASLSTKAWPMQFSTLHSTRSSSGTSTTGAGVDFLGDASGGAAGVTTAGSAVEPCSICLTGVVTWSFCLYALHVIPLWIARQLKQLTVWHFGQVATILPVGLIIAPQPYTLHSIWSTMFVLWGNTSKNVNALTGQLVLKLVIRATTAWMSYCPTVFTKCIFWDGLHVHSCTLMGTLTHHSTL